MKKLCKKRHECVRTKRHRGKCVNYHSVEVDGQWHGQYWEQDDSTQTARLIISAQLAGPPLRRYEAALLFEYMNLRRNRHA